MNRSISSRWEIAALVVALLGWGAPKGYAEPPAKADSLSETSPAFAAGGIIPPQYSCEGGNVSPPLAWTGVPAGTKSLALVCDDPDAPGGMFVHWILYGLPASATSLAENVAPTPTLPNGVKQGANGFGKIGYGGPCPPAGKAHHYFFKLYALDIEVALKPGATKSDLLQVMEHHVLGEGILMGKYQRKK